MTEQPWEIKLREQFAFSNNPGRWKDRQTVDEVIAFIKEELNAPIEQYKKDLFAMTVNQLKVVLAQGHGGGNWRRLITQAIASFTNAQ